jgi:ADP-ribosylglycohydrolase
MKLDWLVPTRHDLLTEERQLKEEGRDVALIADLFRKASLEAFGETFQTLWREILDRGQNLPVVEGYVYEEPSEWEAIEAVLPPAEDTRYQGSVEELRDRVLGGWVGRCCGCLLGKPVEGWSRLALQTYLKETGQYPLCHYIQPPQRTASSSTGQEGKDPFPEYGSGMPEDDDLNYTVLALAVYEEKGPRFTPEDVAEAWLSRLPLLRTFTAERVAYRNLSHGILPPKSASFRNPYREWIGARIRADFWGYVSPCSPRRAAHFAFRDACVSHVKNGIYGAMATSAMVASAFETQDPASLIEVALEHIPGRSRLAEAFRRQQALRKRLRGPEDAIQEIHKLWKEDSPHDWCHVISNTEIVAMALLWGEGDFERSVCLAVEAGMDTDCNGATVGSLLGVLLGYSRLPRKWTDILNDTLYTGVAGFERCSLQELAQRTVKMILQG